MKEITDEIDIHGFTVDEAIPLVDSFLYQSFRMDYTEFGLFTVGEPVSYARKLGVISPNIRW